MSDILRDMPDDVRVRMWELGGRWYARILDASAVIEVTGVSRRECLDELKRVTGDDVTLVIEAVPRIAGVAEAAQIMGWDKRRVITYIDRGSFPEPIFTLASGRVWLSEDIERFAQQWRARRRDKLASALPPIDGAESRADDGSGSDVERGA